MRPPTPPSFPLAKIIGFAEFNNRFAGQSCYVIGRGPTRFDFASLGPVTEPIFFINDAVSMERFATSKTFFFAHDQQMQAWLDGDIRSTAVIPIDGKIFRSTPGSAKVVSFKHAGELVFYHWQEKDAHRLLQLDRDQLAEAGALYTHTGTIHSVLHFIWYCGFAKVNFVGCDGLLGVEYDARIANRSGSDPVGSYASIARVQRLLCGLFGLEAEYRGTPENSKNEIRIHE